MTRELADSLWGSVIPSVPGTCWVSHVPTLGNRSDNDDDDGNTVDQEQFMNLFGNNFPIYMNENETFDNREFLQTQILVISGVNFFLK